MFELIRRFRTAIFIGATVLAALAFGITGVVVDVLAPRRNPNNKVKGTFTLQDATGKKKKIEVRNIEYQRFASRWNQFLLRNFHRTDFLFSRMGMMPNMKDRVVRMVLSQSLRRNLFLQKLFRVQQRSNVSFFQWVVFYKSPPAMIPGGSVSILPDVDRNKLEEMSDSGRKQTLKRRWEEETYWRIYYLSSLANHWGFETTNQELRNVLKFLLNNSRRDISYSQLVEHQAGMNVKQFEKTMKEYLSILKLLASIGQSSGASYQNALSSFKQENGYGKLIYATLDRKNIVEEERQNWKHRVTDQLLSSRTSTHQVDRYSSFKSDATGSSGSRRQNSGNSLESVLEKRKFSYLFVPYNAYLDEVEKPDESELKEYYENNKEDYKREENSSTKANNNSNGDENGESESEDAESYKPFSQVKDRIQETILRKRAMTEHADAALQRLYDIRITELETRGKEVNFQQIAREGFEEIPLSYRTSPLLDKEDMKRWLKEEKGMEKQSHVDRLIKVVFERSLGEGGKPGEYPESPLWFEEGALLPRLVEVDNSFLSPSFSSSENGSGGYRHMSRDNYRNSFPVWSLDLKRNLQNRYVQHRIDQKVQETRNGFRTDYRTEREQKWNELEFIGPPAPFWTLESNSGDGNSEQSSLHGPPASFRNQNFTERIFFERGKFRIARRTFEEMATEKGFQVKETEIFSFQEGVPQETILSGIGNQIKRRSRRGGTRLAQQYDIFTASDDSKVQVAMLLIKLPPSPDDFETYIEENRQKFMSSGIGSHVKNTLAGLLERANLTLESTPPGSSSSDGSSGKQENGDE